MNQTKSCSAPPDHVSFLCILFYLVSRFKKAVKSFLCAGKKNLDFLNLEGEEKAPAVGMFLQYQEQLQELINSLQRGTACVPVVNLYKSFFIYFNFIYGPAELLRFAFEETWGK